MPYRTLMRRSRGEDVKLLQKQLEHLGYKSGPVDGVFGFLTERAVMSFQLTKGLPQDGIVGPRTWKALLAIDEEYEPEVEINLMPLTNLGGCGKALINPPAASLLITCWAMPIPSSLGRETSTGKYYETFTAWLANPEKNDIKKIGQFILDGLEYKLEAEKVNNISRYNLLLIGTARQEDIKTSPGLPLLAGVF